MYHIYIICSNFGSSALASKCSATIALSIVNRSVTMSGLNTTWKIPHEHAKHVEDTTFVRVPGSHHTTLGKLVCENNPLAEGMNLRSLASSCGLMELMKSRNATQARQLSAPASTLFAADSVTPRKARRMSRGALNSLSGCKNCIQVLKPVSAKDALYVEFEANTMADVRKQGIPEGSTSRGAFREARDLQNSHASSSQVSSSQASSLQLQPLKSGLRWAWHGGGSMGPDGQPQPQLVSWSMGPDGLGRDEPMYEDNDTLEMPSTKKSSTQKTPTKKSPAKKSSAKKSPAKTSSTKKSSAKKSSTQKNKRL